MEGQPQLLPSITLPEHIIDSDNYRCYYYTIIIELASAETEITYDSEVGIMIIGSRRPPEQPLQ